MITRQHRHTAQRRPPAPATAVIVPVHNSERYLWDALASVAGQTDRDWECVIVDDGSTDRSAQIAQIFAAWDPRFRVVSQRNGGVSAARNRGFRELTPGVRNVVYLDSDDIWLPDALSTLRCVAHRDPAAIGAHCLARRVDANGEPAGDAPPDALAAFRRAIVGRRVVSAQPLHKTDFRVLIATPPFASQGSILVRRAAYEQAGPWDERFSAGEDWDMMVRLARVGHLVFSEDVVLHYRRHETNRTNSADVFREDCLARAKAFYSPDNTPAQRTLARRMWRHQERVEIARWLALSARDLAGGPGALCRLRRSALHLGYFASATLGYLAGRPLKRVDSSRRGW